MPPVIAIGFLGLAGLLAARFVGALQEAAAERAETQAQERAFRAANGWSAEEVAAELVSGFDQDNDGRLAFDVVKGASMLGEATSRTLVRRWTESANLFGIPTGVRVMREAHATYTIEPTLRKADADGDGIGTRTEVAALLRSYDDDANGRLSAAERGQALAALGRVLVSREEKTVGIVPPPTPARPPLR